jgi:hypothetical protein
MKTYQETIQHLALIKAHAGFAGDPWPVIQGIETVASIYGKTERQIRADIEKEMPAAERKAMYG